MGSPSDAEVIGRSLGEPEAFGLIYDRHAAPLLRFLGRRAGAKVAEGLVGELFRIAFERRTTFDVSRASALPLLGPLVGYGIDAWGLPSVLSALGILFSLVFVFLLLPLVLEERPLAAVDGPRD